jgi:magnesium chelatase subunit I
LNGDAGVSQTHIRQVAPMALNHRLRRNPLDEAGSGVRIERAMTELFDS